MTDPTHPHHDPEAADRDDTGAAGPAAFAPSWRPFQTAIEGLASSSDWPVGNTVSVRASSVYLPHLDTTRGADDAVTDDDDLGVRQVVRVDTNYKPTRPGQHPVELSRVAAIELAAAVLTAVEDTFHYSRVGRLRPREAVEVLRAVEAVDAALLELRSHALNDLHHPDTADPDSADPVAGPDRSGADEPGEPAGTTVGLTQAVEPESEAAAPAAVEPLGWEEQARRAVAAVFTPGVAETVTTSDAFGALAYRLREHHDSTGAGPRAVLAGLDPDVLDFAARADDPAAFLASRVAQL